MKKIKNYLKLMRIKHYLKNFLILFPLIFSGNLFKVDYLSKSIIGVIIFSLTSSIIYILNDIKDINQDKLHEKKKFRPLASGAVSIKEAIFLIILLLGINVILLIIFKIDYFSLILLSSYLILNIAYSLGLKNIAILDIVILMSGFLIRVLYGATIIDVPVSNWLYLTIMSMAFYLALGKRRNETIKSNNTTRLVLKDYNKEFLDKNMYMSLTLAIVFYSLWTVDPRINNPYLIWTVPLLIVICMRYNLIVEGDSYGDPVEVITNDIFMIILAIVYALSLLMMMYL